MCIRCEIEELLRLLCECEGSFRCEWHKKLKTEDRDTVVQEMRDELDNRHYAWAIEQGIVDPDED